MKNKCINVILKKVGLNNSTCGLTETNSSLKCLTSNHFQCHDNTCQCDWPYLWVSGSENGLSVGGCNECQADSNYVWDQTSCGLFALNIDRLESFV